MESQDEHSSISAANQISYKNFFSRNKLPIIAGLVILTILIVYAFYFFNSKQSIAINKKSNETVTQTPLVQSGIFRDDELGIVFQVPESWGDTLVRNDFSMNQILREISFSNQPSVKLISVTEHRLKPALLDHSGISGSTNIQSFCESQLSYLSSGDEPKTVNGQDQFRQNGSYNFGNCAATPSLLNISKKIPTTNASWIPANNSKTSASSIELSRSFFWSLQNQIYNSLTLQVNIPGTTSDGFCTAQLPYGGDTYRLNKNFSCINHKEKEQIETAFRNFDSTQLSKEVNSLINSLQTYPTENAVSIYRNHFKDKSVFRDTVLGISFSYPSVFGEPKYDINTKTITFPNGGNDILRIEVNTLADIAQEEKAAAECEGPCLNPLTSQERWETEKNILTRGTLGQFQCSLDGGRYCETVNVGNTKMLVQYYNQWPITESIRKEYTFYISEKRFDWLIGSYGIFTSDVAEYKKSEKDDFTLNLVREILESVKVEK